MSSPQQTAPHHVRLAEEFRRRITSGEWQAGTQIPSEAALCHEFGISRGPVRQALQALRTDGLVTGGRGRPPMIRGTVPSQPFATLMSFTEWAHGIGREPGQRTLEVALRTASPEAAEALGLEPGAKVVEVLRLRLLDDVPAMVEHTSFAHAVGRHLFDFDADSGSIFAFLKGRGVDLYGARHTIDAVPADAQDAGLLGVPDGTALLRERRVTLTREGERVEYSEDCYLPGLTSFTIDNTVDSRAALARVPATE